MSVRYIGSKERIADAILEVVGAPGPGSTFVDAFCGTGVVAERAALRGWPVRLNDTLTCATTMAAARVAPESSVSYESLGGYEQAVRRLNGVAPVEGFLWREYSPASTATVGIARCYFTERNAAKLDAARHQIADWATSGILTPSEENLLVADLLNATNSVANIAGTYGCFLREFTSSALQPVTIRARRLFPRQVHVEVSNVDARLVRTAPADVVYYDPPYTKRQYAAYYHILETVAFGDEPLVAGITGLRPWQAKASDYCYKRKALGSLVQLVAEGVSRRVVLSYSSEGHVALTDLKSRLDEFGTVRVYDLGEVGRYRPNRAASAAASSVAEYVIEFLRRDVLEEVA